MLTILHPGVLPELALFPYGLIPLNLPDEPIPTLAIKATKEVLLTARVNSGFKIYLFPMTLEGRTGTFLMSAFADDSEEPLVIATPLFDEPMFRSVVDTVLSNTVNIHFFDENNRELLAFKSAISMPALTREALQKTAFLPLSLESAQAAPDQMAWRFGTRGPDAEAAAIDVRFGESLIPEELWVQDLRPDQHAFHGGEGRSEWSLVRELPGPGQELDIVFLFQRIFGPTHIYLNPRRTTDNKEITDILVATERNLLIVQAKDSPNTPEGVKKTLDKKRKAAVSALEKAVDQVRGAARYLNGKSAVEVRVGDKVETIGLEGRNLYGLVVVKELFDDSYATYTPMLLGLSADIQGPCIALDYRELHTYTQYLKNEHDFFQAFLTVYKAGADTGRFIRLRFGLTDE